MSRLLIRRFTFPVSYVPARESFLSASVASVCVVWRNSVIVVVSRSQAPMLFLTIEHKHLKKIGIPVTTGHSRKNISDFNPDLVVYSGAVFADNPERAEAKDRNIPLVERAVFLGAINCLFDKVINVAGTNGKSSVVAMCALIMIESQLDPTVHLGRNCYNLRQLSGSAVLIYYCQKPVNFARVFSTIALRSRLL